MSSTTDADTAYEVYRPGPVGRVLRVVERGELLVGGVLLLLILLLVASQVLTRVTSLNSPVWTGEIARFSLYWLAFGMAGYLMGREEHVTLTAIDHALPPLARTVVHRFSLLVVAAACLSFAYEGYDLLTSTGNLRSPAAGIPVGWLYILPTAGLLLSGVRALLMVLVPAARPLPRPMVEAPPLPGTPVEPDAGNGTTQGSPA